MSMPLLLAAKLDLIISASFHFSRVNKLRRRVVSQFLVNIPQSMFSEGNVILLQSRASRTNIRIYDGEVQGSSDDGPACECARTNTHAR